MDKKRIDIKVGTSTLTHATGKTNIRIMTKLTRVLADLQNMGHEIILVSSGAIAVGASKLGLTSRPTQTATLQATAAVGQGELMFLYDKLFGEYNVTVSQLLITAANLDRISERKHLVETFNELIRLGAIPIVNENDSVYVDELVSGDNDCLSAQVATLINADLLILLTDTDGLFDSNPSENENAKLISEVFEITDDIENVAGGAGEQGTGGFITKIKAAKIANEQNIDVVVTNGNRPSNIYKILDGEPIGTKFLGN